MAKTFLILGGYGNTGRLIADLLLAHTPINLILAGRNLTKATELANILNAKYNGQRVSARQVEAAKPASLQSAFSSIDFVVVASSTSEFVQNVARTALEAGIDYLDIHYSLSKLRILHSLANDIEKAGRCFITDGGFHPGLPAALIRYAASAFDRLQSAEVASLLKQNWQGLSFSEATLAEFARELMDFKTQVFKNGNWVKASWRERKSYAFGREFGRCTCMPMFLEELRPLPEQIPTLQQTGFYISGFNSVVDYMILPFAFAAIKLFGPKALKLAGRMLEWGLVNFSKPPYGTIVLLQASGICSNRKKELQVRLFHEDGYAMTAIPVACCLMQYLQDDIRKPGLWYQAHIVEPVKLLQQMQKLGIRVDISEQMKDN